MAARKPKIEKSAVPEYVQQNRLMQKRKITKRTLPSFTEAMMLLHAPEAQRLAWKALCDGAAAGNKDCVRQILEIFGLVQRSGGVTINQQIMQNNAIAGDTAPVKGFDALVREIAEKRAGHSLPAPSDVVVEVHPVESVGA